MYPPPWDGLSGFSQIFKLIVYAGEEVLLTRVLSGADIQKSRSSGIKMLAGT